MLNPFMWQHLGPIAASTNPTYFIIVIVMLGFSIFATLFSLITAFRQKHIGVAIGFALGFGIGDVLLIYGFWLSAATAIGSLPFHMPSNGATWLFFLPAQGTYFILAVAAHIILLICAVEGLWFSWTVGQIHLPSNDTAITIYFIIGMVFTAAVWEYNHIFLWFLVISELAILFFVAALGAAIVDEVITFYVTRIQHQDIASGFIGRQILRFDNSIWVLLFSVGTFAIFLLHNITASWINFIGLFVAFILFDDVAAFWGGIRVPLKTDEHYLTPRRWVITVPFSLVIIVLGASGVFAPFTLNSGFTSTVWLTAGTAAMTFMIFKPLSDLAKYSAGVRETQLQNQAAILFNPLRRTASDSESTDTESVPATLPHGGTTRQNAQVSSNLPPSFQSVTLFEKLRFPARGFFLITGLSYFWLITNSNLPNLLNSGLVPLVFAVTAVVTSIIPLLNNPKLDPTREIFILFLFFISILAGASLLFSANLSSAQLQHLISTNVTGPFYSGQFQVGAAYNILIEALLLLTIGQLAYFYVLINTVISFEQEIHSAEDWVDAGDTLLNSARYDPARYDSAEAMYRRALETDANSVEALNGCGNVAYAQQKFTDARDYYERTLKIDSNLDGTLSNLGNTLLALGYYGKAVDVFLRAITLNEDSVDSWNGKGQSLVGLKRYDDAIAAFDQALHLDPSQDYVWTNKALALSAMGNTPLALTVINDALDHLPENASLRVNKGWFLIQLKQYAEGMSILYDITENRVVPKAVIAAAWNCIGYAYKYQGNYVEAITSINKALNLDENNGNYWDSLSEFQLASQHYQDAIEAADHALTRDGTLTTSLQFKAQALRALGKENEAAKVEEKLKLVVDAQVAPPTIKRNGK